MRIRKLSPKIKRPNRSKILRALLAKFLQRLRVMVRERQAAQARAPRRLTLAAKSARGGRAPCAHIIRGQRGAPCSRALLIRAIPTRTWALRCWGPIDEVYRFLRGTHFTFIASLKVATNDLACKYRGEIALESVPIESCDERYQGHWCNTPPVIEWKIVRVPKTLTMLDTRKLRRARFEMKSHMRVF